MRKPSRLISRIQPGPEGGALARDGKHRFDNPQSGASTLTQRHAVCIQITSKEELTAISHYFVMDWASARARIENGRIEAG
jgi:hypothetical protein